jgi:transposase-like protein
LTSTILGILFVSDHATLRDAIIHFSEFENRKDWMVELRWPDGKVKCPTCGAEKVTYLAKRRVWKCYADHKSPTFSLKTGTIFEDSPIALEKWLPAVSMLLSCKNGLVLGRFIEGLASPRNRHGSCCTASGLPGRKRPSINWRAKPK